MSRKNDHVLQVKITLDGIKPPIWRRIQVPWRYTFWDLHVAIQDAMGWSDCHLHEFSVKSPFLVEAASVGIPDDDAFEDQPPTFPGWLIPVARFLTLEQRRIRYVYDFGDDWQHTVLLEKILPAEKGVVYPRCLGGRRACPPEDVGGPDGFDEFLEALADPEHDEHESYLEWIGGSYDPAAFDKGEVHFEDPGQRFRLAFGDPQGEDADPVPRIPIEEGEKVPVTLTLDQREQLLDLHYADPAVIAPLRLCAIDGNQAMARMSLEQIATLMTSIAIIVRNRRDPRTMPLLEVGRALRKVLVRYVEFR